MDNIRRNLRKLGLGELEIKIYILLLKKGSLKISEIATQLKLNRSSIYNYIKNLQNYSLVQEDVSSSVSKYTISSSTDIHSLLNREKKKIEKLSEIVEELTLSVSEYETNITTSSLPRITFINDPEIEDYLYEHAGKWNKTALNIDNTWWGFQDAEFAKNYFSWINFLWKEVHDSGYVKLFTNSAKIENRFSGMKIKNREIKTLNESQFKGTTWVVGDYVIILNTQENKEYLVEIKDRHIADNYRDIFRELWKKTK